MSTPTRYVAPIHFEDFSGDAFERQRHKLIVWWRSIRWDILMLLHYLE